MESNEDRNDHRLGARLRAARGYAGLSETVLAERIGAHRGSVRNWEEGLIPALAGRKEWIIENYAEATEYPVELIERDFATEDQAA